MLQAHQFLCLAASPVASSAAVRQAVHLAAERGATVHVVPYEAEAPSALEEEVQTHRHRLQQGGSLFVHEALPSGGKEAFVEALRRSVNELGVDVLVIDAPTERGPVPPLSEEWIRALVDPLDCSIFAVQGVEVPESIQRLLVPVDFSDQSVETLERAVSVASCYDAEIVLLHVIDTSPYVALTPVDRLSLGRETLSEHRARRQLRQFVQNEGSEDVPIRLRIAFGIPGDQIVHVIDEEDVDLLMLATHGRGGGATDRPLGAVTDRVLRRAVCPTVLVRASGTPPRSEQPEETRPSGRER